MANTETATTGGQATPALSAGATGRTTKRKAKQGGYEGSSAVPLYGTRIVKHFPISESELKQLGERRNAGTAFSSAGTGLIGVGVGLLKDAVFTDKPKTLAAPLMIQPQLSQDFNWTPIAIAMIIGGLVLLAVGIYSIFAGKSLAQYIEDGTKFDE